MAQDIEKVGSFFLGRQLDVKSGAATDNLVLYESKDLTTHAVIVGMTGSGKTGLGIAMLEEAAMDGIPSIVLDPKGDLGNLLLSFPELRPSDFRPWIDEQEAQRQGQSPDAFAESTAATWKKGLADWGQDGARVAKFKNAAEAVIYTPGSNAGLPLTILRSFAAPPQAILDDNEALRERVLTTASSLLGLLGIDADPVKAREHVLLSNLLDHAWREGRDLDIASLIREIQAPPIRQIGVVDVDAFYPPKDRAALAMTLNGLLASPGFAAWMSGEPLDVQKLLWTKDGKPRIAVISIAHLSDAERMFFVSTLLNEVVAWVRQQPGTSSLRALLYMDEVFGYFPPTANPPSKLPMLTLLKQARAFGLGVVLATQNPVDLDYKGLGNAGTWLLGRLQTDRDKMRVLDGLESAAAAAGSFNRATYDNLLSNLKKRCFLMVNAKEDKPTLLTTRWCLSYLAGPVTRAQIATLKASFPATALAASKAAISAPPPASTGGERETSGGGTSSRTTAPSAVRPMVPSGVAELFLPWRGSASGGRLEYRPAILGSSRVHYVDAKNGVDTWEEVKVWSPVPDETASDPWEGSTAFEGDAPEFEKSPDASAGFTALPAAISKPKAFAGWQKALEDHLYRVRSVTLWKATELRLSSNPGETEKEFRVRIGTAAGSTVEADVAAVEKKWASKLTTLTDRVRVAQQKVEREKAQKKQSWIAAILGVLMAAFAMFASKRGSAGAISRAGTAAKGMGKMGKESQDVAMAEESSEVLTARLAEFTAQRDAEIAALRAKSNGESVALVEVKVTPRKSDLVASPVVLLWTPYRVSADGSASPAF